MPVGVSAKGWQIVGKRQSRLESCGVSGCQINHLSDPNRLVEAKSADRKGYVIDNETTRRYRNGGYLPTSVAEATLHVVYGPNGQATAPLFIDGDVSGQGGQGEENSQQRQTRQVESDATEQASSPAEGQATETTTEGQADAGSGATETSGEQSADDAELEAWLEAEVAAEQAKAAAEAAERAAEQAAEAKAKAEAAKQAAEEAKAKAAEEAAKQQQQAAEQASTPVLAEIVGWLAACVHVWLVGPAGTGKTTLATMAAKALGLTFYSIQVGPMTTEAKLLGYFDANGRYIRSIFREAYEYGGLFLLDEIDAAHPGVLTILNAALANGSMAFPDGMVSMHVDFRAIAAANTAGNGADKAYRGRQGQDAATINRFAYVPVDLNSDVERAMCLATGADAKTVDRVISFATYVREQIKQRQLHQYVVSPRNTERMCKGLAFLPWETAANRALKANMSDDDWQRVSSGWRA